MVTTVVSIYNYLPNNCLRLLLTVYVYGCIDRYLGTGLPAQALNKLATIQQSMISEFFYAIRTFRTRRRIRTPFSTYYGKYLRVASAMRDRILHTIGTNSYYRCKNYIRIQCTTRYLLITYFIIRRFLFLILNIFIFDIKYATDLY